MLLVIRPECTGRTISIPCLLMAWLRASPSLQQPGYWSCEINWSVFSMKLQWRHNEHSSVSNHQPCECLLNRLFGHRSKKTSKLRVTGLCAGNSQGTGPPPPPPPLHKGPITRKMFPLDDVIMRREIHGIATPSAIALPRNGRRANTYLRSSRQNNLSCKMGERNPLR